MTTFEATTPPPRPTLFARLLHSLAESRRRRAELRIIEKLSRYDAHMLRDMGLDPADIERSYQNRNLSVLFHPLPPGERR